MTSDYKVRLDVFSGPLDLLLFLVRRDELDIQDITLARVTRQYLEHVRLLEQLDPNSVGEFLVMASTLIEMKSRALLPSPPIEAMDEEEEQRVALVRQLLEYKRFKDAARSLGRAADDRSRIFPRRPADIPEELRGVELEEAEVWDLLSAFGRVMTAIGRGPGVHEVRYDDIPLESYIERIVDDLGRSPATTFRGLFREARTRLEVIGMFLALLELVRRRRLLARQAACNDEIYLIVQDEVDELGGEQADFAETPAAAVDLPTPSSEPVNLSAVEPAHQAEPAHDDILDEEVIDDELAEAGNDDSGSFDPFPDAAEGPLVDRDDRFDEETA